MDAFEIIDMVNEAMDESRKNNTQFIADPHSIAVITYKQEISNILKKDVEKRLNNRLTTEDYNIVFDM